MSIEVKNITIQETPETDEALKLLNNAKEKYTGIVVLELILFLFLLVSGIANWNYPNTSGPLLFFASLAFIILLATLHIRKTYLAPYYELLRIARLNDKIRHEERIRFRERIRLEEEHKNPNEQTVKIKPAEIIKQNEEKVVQEPVNSAPISQRPILRQNQNVIPIKKDIQNN